MAILTNDELREAYDRHRPWIEQQTGVASTGYGAGADSPLSIWVFGDEIPFETKEAIRRRVGEIPVDFLPAPPHAELH